MLLPQSEASKAAREQGPGSRGQGAGAREQGPGSRLCVFWFRTLRVELSNPRAKRACSGLFTDLTIYLYGGTSADLSKIPPLLRGIVICFRR